MNIVYESNTHLKKFFHHYAKHNAIIRNDISNRLIKLVEENSHKIKTAGKMRYKSHRILEYKIVLDKDIFCRVAFTVVENTIHIIFISDKIRKNVYYALLAKTDIID